MKPNRYSKTWPAPALGAALTRASHGKKLQYGRSLTLCVGFLGYFAMAGLCGCSPRRDAPGTISVKTEPALGGTYHLYRPAKYDRSFRWPLFVVCHSGFPDNAERQLNAWIGAAEQKGFLVAAPQLESAAREGLFGDDQRASKIERDERHILATIRHIEAGNRISPERIILYGYRGGAPIALRIGLGRPDLFRVIALSSPKFDERWIEPVSSSIDPTQPVYVRTEAGDALIGDEERRCVDWLLTHNALLVNDPFGPAGLENTAQVVDAIEQLLRSHPLARIELRPASQGHSNEVQFSVRSSHRLTEYRWTFDGADRSQVADPIFQFDEPGTHRVAVELTMEDGRRLTRAIEVEIPSMKVRRLPSARD